MKSYLIVVLIIVTWLPAVGQRSSYDPAAKQPGNPLDGFVDFALKQVNPQNKDYGCQIDDARKLLVDETIKSVTSWAMLVALSFLILAFFLLLHQHRERHRREIISIATNERFKDKSGEWQDRTEWHNVLAWERLAEIVGEHVRKGSKIYIEGRLQTSAWEDRQSGEKKYRTEIVARDLVLLGSRDGAEPETGDSHRERETVHAGSGEITDEDIPF